MINGKAQAESARGAKPDTLISMVLSATDIQTRDFDPHAAIEIIRSGGEGICEQVEAIRKTFRSELDWNDYKHAKEAIGPAKIQLPAVLWSGSFTDRKKPVDEKKLKAHSGLLCADLDNLGPRLEEVREKLLRSPYVWAVFTSPSGDGLKAVFRVPADGSKHHGSFRSVKQYVKEFCGVQIDESCKDVARLCFISYDPEIFHNPGAVEILPLPEPERPRYVNGASVDLSARQRIAAEILGAVDWESGTAGFVTCPGKHLHTTANKPEDCKVYLDGHDGDKVPSIYCFHNSCRGILDGVNHEFRSRIGQAEWTPGSNGQQSNGHAGKKNSTVDAEWADSGSQTKSDNAESDREKKEKPSPWAKAMTAPEFCTKEFKKMKGLAKDLIIPGTVTLLAAPRGIGKTLVAHDVAVVLAKGGEFRGEYSDPLNVLLADRDNPAPLVQERLIGWGALGAPNLKVLTREDGVPDLKDKAAWEIFPVKDYDVIVIDSLGSFTEGITEKEGRETTLVLATIRDLIMKGPAVFLLANCTKDALTVRGRGEWMDLVDIQYEVRDATDFVPSGKGDWWLELPEAGESAWAERASRRKKRVDYRLAFVPSKFRGGAWPDPFCLEVHLPENEPWTLEDVTKDLIEAGENTIKEAATKKEKQEEEAANTLAQIVKERHEGGKPILKTEAEIHLNSETGISRKRCRDLITAKKGVLWDIRPIGGKGGGSGLFPVYTNTMAKKMNRTEYPPQTRTSQGGNLAARAQSGRQKCTTRRPAPRADLPGTLFSTPVGGNSREQGPNGGQKSTENDTYQGTTGEQDDDGFEDVPK